MCCMPSSRESPTLHKTNTHKQQPQQVLPVSLSMDIQSCLKASVLSLSILSTVTWLPQTYSSLSTFFLVSLLPSPRPSSRRSASSSSPTSSSSSSSASPSSRSGSESLETGDDNGDLFAAEGDMLQRKEQEEVVMEAFAASVEEIKQEDNVVIDQEEDTAAVYEAEVQLDQQDEEDDMVFCGVDEMRGEVVEEEGGVGLMLEEEMRGGEDRREEEELEERDLPPADELNRRVEDFIARFNMERQLEARMLVCCC